jgi:hypothetical protein
MHRRGRREEGEMSSQQVLHILAMVLVSSDKVTKEGKQLQNFSITLLWFLAISHAYQDSFLAFSLARPQLQVTVCSVVCCDDTLMRKNPFPNLFNESLLLGPLHLLIPIHIAPDYTAIET